VAPCTTKNKQTLSEQIGELNAGEASRRQKVWLFVAALWLEVMVVVFVVVEINRRVRTPLSDWVNRMILLLGAG